IGRSKLAALAEATRELNSSMSPRLLGAESLALSPDWAGLAVSPQVVPLSSLPQIEARGAGGSDTGTQLLAVAAIARGRVAGSGARLGWARRIPTGGAALLAAAAGACLQGSVQVCCVLSHRP